MKKILVIGANGQIGSVLTEALVMKHGKANVIATDIVHTQQFSCEFTTLSVLDTEQLTQLIRQNNITQIYHLAAILSAKGEANPIGTWNFNMQSLFNVLEIGRQENIEKIFFPSTIAVFGPEAPKFNTPQLTALHPTTVYGISKSAAENWLQYYWLRYGLDVRSLRYPGIISYQSPPGGGTTDYAVDIYHKAVLGEHYDCYLKEDARLPMCYMDDAIRATIEIMDAPKEQIRIRTSYNLFSMDFTPNEIFENIKKHVPNFSISYNPDFRQKIAESWTATIDDTEARNDWGWKPEFDLDKMTQIMLEQLRLKYA